MRLAVFSVLALCFIGRALCDTILFLPFTDGSHIIQMDAVATAMLNRGHTTYMLLQAGFSMPKNADKRSKVVYFGQAKSAEQMAALTKHNSDGGPGLGVMQSIVDATCIEMVTDATLWRRLEDLKVDLIVLDYFLYACYYLVPYKLQKPFATVSSGVPMFNIRMPVLPSVTSYMVEAEHCGPIQCHTGHELPGIIERFCRLTSHLLNEMIPIIFETDMHAYLDYPSISLLRSKISVALINNSPLLGAVFPGTPRNVFVGGLTAKPASPLPSDLQAWMDQANDVIVVSFGSRFTGLANSGNDKLLTAFAKLPFRFLVRFREEEYRDVQLSPNIKIMEWLPQNDVLGHNNTLLMITHCGLNGLFEALYHAVPVICLYVHTDQPANSRKIERLGFGYGQKASEFKSDWIVETVKEMTSNSSYRSKIGAASRIFRSQDKPSERAANALEHVLRFGDEHLIQSDGQELTWWQFYMLDVVAVVYTIILVFFYVFYKIVRFVFSRLLRLVKSQ